MKASERDKQSKRANVKDLILIYSGNEFSHLKSIQSTLQPLYLHLKITTNLYKYMNTTKNYNWKQIKWILNRHFRHTKVTAETTPPIHTRSKCTKHTYITFFVLVNKNGIKSPKINQIKKLKPKNTSTKNITHIYDIHNSHIRRSNTIKHKTHFRISHIHTLNELDILWSNRVPTNILRLKHFCFSGQAQCPQIHVRNRIKCSIHTKIFRNK